MHIALLGGTFNPPHMGHVHVATRLSKRFDEVWLVVANDPNKKEKPYVNPQHRLAMAKLAVASIPNAKVSDVEIRRGGTSYTTDTLKELSDSHSEHAFTWVIGADLLSDFPRWKDSAALAQRARFAVVSRPGYPIKAKALRGFSHIQIMADASGVDASSTQIRQWIHESKMENAKARLPNAVSQYIRKNKLYG
ncbi:nicotinate (nicotinamide) nucleotide adenylyltransferase [Candidatus Micrarchaeota archaeon]|nr:nicotinate (nicotinamide) nucleotide adenylyltransferase [Candidatus Micrarchaeota archaeon]